MDYHQTYSASSSSSHSNHLQPRVNSQRSLASVPSLNNNHHHSSSAVYHHCLTTLKVQDSSYPSSLTLSGKFLYTGSSDREISSWNRSFEDSDSNSTTNKVVAGKGAVKSLVIQSDTLFSAHQDHKIRVWKISNSHQKHTHLATLPTLGDRAAKVLHPKNQVQIRRHKKCTWVHHVDTVSALTLSQDGALLYSVSWDRAIKIWRTRDFTCLESLTNAHDDAINAVAVSTDGRVYSGSADKTIKVWGKLQGEKKHSLLDTMERHNSGVNALALSGDESLLYSGACDRSVLVWEKEGEDGGRMVVVGALRGHTNSILCLAVVAVLDLVCSGSADKTIRIWKGIGHREYSCLAVLEGHAGSIKCLSAVVDFDDAADSEASFLVYSGSLDCDVKVWQIFVPAS
ncbi:protein JINGUBANG [Lotus japonicus]|uniref:protein JINGUBANG n=1 Tax=Lotus japonicus TaxID=34305 RepID=UPI00258D6229|nr:protein JINGUBANG [Lotus japonicus]